MSALPISYDFDATGEIITFPHPQIAARSGERILPSTRSKAATSLSPTLARFALRGLGLFVVCGFAFLVSGLAGNVALEGARRESIRDSQRFRQVIREEIGLASDVTRLRSEESISAWASYNLFIPSYTLDQKSAITARTFKSRHAAI